MLGFILFLIVIGLIAGFLARAIVPGPDPMGIVGTIVLGIVGSFVGGWLGRLLFDSDAEGLSVVGIITAVVGAILVLLVYRAVTSNGRSVTR